jgi:general secretion pathway protein G
MNERDQQNPTSATRAIARTSRRTSAHERFRRLLARGAAGMTLIEIMVVVIIMGLIASAVGFGVFKFLAKAKIKTAEQEVQHIRSAIQIYQNDHPDQCPTVDQMRTDGQLDRNASANDPWNHPFTINCDGENISVVSMGPDGRAGTQDDIPQASGAGGGGNNP